MSEEKHETELDPGAAVIRGFLYRALEIMARDLRQSAAAAGGMLDRAAIDSVLAGMKDPKSPVMGAVCRAAWQDCSRLFESEARREDRKAPFERLMVWPFAHLLPAGGNRDGGKETISRRILPGFTTAIEDLVGPVSIGRQQERARKLVLGIRNKRGGAFTWEDVYAEPTARVIVDDILVALAAEFENFEAQRDWFIGLVNDAMPLPTNGAGHATALDDENFAAIMLALYGDLVRRLETEDGDAMIAARYGRPAVDQVLALIDELKQD